MAHPIEGGGLDSGIVDHILEDDLIADGKGTRKTPRTHEVAREAGVATQSIKTLSPLPRKGESTLTILGGLRVNNVLSSTDLWIIWHLEAIGHVAGEGNIEDGGADAMVLNNIYDGGNKGTRLPCEGRTRFKDHLKMRVAGMEVTEGLHEEFHVIVLACHEMTATEIDPLELREPR